MAENGNGTKARIWNMIAGIALAAAVGWGSATMSFGGYARQVEVNTARLAAVEGKVEKVERIIADLEWIKDALRDNNVEHREILAVLNQLKKK